MRDNVKSQYTSWRGEENQQQNLLQLLMSKVTPSPGSGLDPDDGLNSSSNNDYSHIYRSVLNKLIIENLYWIRCNKTCTVTFNLK